MNNAFSRMDVGLKIIYIKRWVLDIFENCAYNRDWNQITAGYTAHCIHTLLRTLEGIEYTIINGTKKFTVDVFIIDSSGEVVNMHFAPKF